MTIHAVVWDVDDTLFDYRTADRSGIAAHVVAEGLSSAFESPDHALARWFEVTEHHWARVASGELTYEEHCRERVRAFTGRDLDDDEADAWFARYIVHYESAWALFPDFLPALDALVPSHRHAVLSNSSLLVQERKLRTLGVLDRFEAVLCAVDLGVSKPAAEAFHAACDALGLPPEQVAYVGDHPEIDGRGAAEAGLLSVWIDRHGEDPAEEGDGAGERSWRRIRSLAELPSVLGTESRFGARSTFG
ncbi:MULTISPECIES: HAD family hydrolase [Streptomyces]|uniref:HAD family hydrolase n=1 Tax=Streptomyces TaxID=1883 RepID=UPI00140C8016|nr:MULTISPECIES: HAD family hydrolase [Streptomyces]MDH6224797.1 putative hydrolase of the HAD superfamily [Streptomyces sp. MJP52]